MVIHKVEDKSRTIRFHATGTYTCFFYSSHLRRARLWSFKKLAGYFHRIVGVMCQWYFDAVNSDQINILILFNILPVPSRWPCSTDTPQDQFIAKAPVVCSINQRKYCSMNVNMSYKEFFTYCL